MIYITYRDLGIAASRCSPTAKAVPPQGAVKRGKHMHISTDLVASFAAGSAFGYAIAFLRFRSRLKFYRYLTERRLTAIKKRLVDSNASAREQDFATRASLKT